MNFASLISIVAARQTVNDVLAIANLANQRNDIFQEETTYKEALKDYPNDPRLKGKYTEFLLKTGKYQEIIDQKLTDEDKLKKEDLMKYILILKYKTLSEIDKLAAISPNSFDVMIIASEMSLAKKDYALYDRYIRRAEMLQPNSKKVCLLQAMYNMNLGKYDNAIKLYKKGEDHKTATELEGVVTEYNIIKANFGSTKGKFDDYKKLYTKVFILFNKDRTEPSIYKKLVTTVLQNLVDIGCMINDGAVLTYADRLVGLEKNVDTCYLHIKSAIQVGELKKAKYYLGEYSKFFTASITSSLDRMIEEKKKKVQEEEERKQREENSNRKNVYTQTGGTSNAGKDFLGYYKALGVTKTATEKEIKKAYRKAAAKANMNTKDKDREELKAVNKAFEILSVPSKKEIYDKGTDPESPEAQGQAYYGGQNAYRQESAEDFFNAFFGGGGRRGGSPFGGGRYSYSYTYVL